MGLSNSSLDIKHIPVMLQEATRLCSFKKNSIYLDCTFGGGSYSRKILSKKNTKVIALDRDEFVNKFANELKKEYPNRFEFHIEKFSNIDKVVKNTLFDAVIFDLGLSNFQLKYSDRGFSFKSKNKLNMNMGLSSESLENILNNFSEKNLSKIIKVFGEEKDASRIARNITKFRKKEKIIFVNQLVKIIESSKKKNFKQKINVCTQTFQAFRMFINKEISELINGITKATKILKPGGKIIVVTFHSIEDKIVKYYFKNYSSSRPLSSRYFPEKNTLDNNLFKKYKNTIITPSKKEIKLNSKSRSAKLRFAERSSNIFLKPEDLKKKFKKYMEIERIDA